jgi:hypothetical protein
MVPLHLPANTDQAPTTTATHKATPPTVGHHCHKLRWVSRCGASKKGTTSMTPSPHVHKGLGFHPGNLCYTDVVVLNGVLNRENDTPRVLPPLPPTVETFVRNTTPAAHSPPMAEASTPHNHDTSTGRSPTPPEAPPWHHRQALADPDSTTRAVPDQRRRGGAPPTS